MGMTGKKTRLFKNDKLGVRVLKENGVVDVGVSSGAVDEAILLEVFSFVQVEIGFLDV
jgi:hypothetical protein